MRTRSSPRRPTAIEQDFLIDSVDRLRFDGMPEPEPIRARAVAAAGGTLTGPGHPETTKGPEASEKNSRASDPFSVRAIQDSNLWPLAPEGVSGSSTTSSGVQPVEEAGGEEKRRGADGRPGPSWTVPRGTPVGPSRVLRTAEVGAGRLLSVREVAARLGASTAIVYRFYELGEFAHVRISNAYRVRPPDLERFIIERRRRGKG